MRFSLACLLALALLPAIALGQEAQTSPLKEEADPAEHALILETVLPEEALPATAHDPGLATFHDAVISDLGASVSEPITPAPSLEAQLAFSQLRQALGIVDITYVATLETLAGYPHAVAKIQKSQRLWEAYVEPHCEAELAFEEDLNQASLSKCLLREADLRATWLRALGPTKAF